ncbi:MAG: MBL fold metallo-hydrolase [Acidobacteriia bacterium]|nr:MBL fold metallo-hydrolase [Terriglobia bacterium]
MRLAILLLPCLLSAQVVRTADPIKRGMKLTDIPRTVKVAENVYTYEDYHSGAEKFTTTNMFVVTNDGVFLADAQGSPEQTQGLVDAIHKITPKPIKVVIIASDHGDHTGGNSVLPPGITYYIHPNSKAILEGQARGWKPPADIKLVSDKETIHLGGVEFQVLFLGRAHTGGDLSVYLPKQKILFLSETYLNRVFPAMRSAYPSEWLKALDRAEKIDANLYIAGHGFTEDAAVSKEELHEYHKALKYVIDEATRLYQAGVPVDQAVKQANWGEYGSWTLAGSQGPIAVRKVYEELSGKLH